MPPERLEAPALEPARPGPEPPTANVTESPRTISADIDSARAAIARARSSRKLAFQKNDDVVSIVKASLRRRGAFYHDGLRSYVFITDLCQLIALDLGEVGLELLLVEYGLYPNENLTKQVTHALRLEALKSGRRTEVHAFAYYGAQTHVLYIYDFEGGIYRLTATTMDLCPNGTDGVLFIQNPHWTPLRLVVLSAEPALDWRGWLLEGIHFAPGTLTEADQRLLFVFWVLALFFPQLFPTRVILALIGEKGSAKSSLLRRLGQLLFGPKFNVSALTAKPDDFDAAITTDPLVVADNADDAPAWLPDKLAVAATGGAIKRRQLYTTNTVEEYPIVATVAVTSRTPNFQREDIAERVLPLNMVRIDRFEAESSLLADVQAQRNEIVSNIVWDVWRAVAELEAQKDHTNRTTFRMADFADFLLKIAPVISTREEVEALLDRLSGQQVAFASGDEPLFPLIDQWLAQDDDHVNVDREIPMTQLGEELAAIAAGTFLPWDAGSAKSFGQYFRARKGTLRELYQMTWREGHGGKVLVSLKPRPR